MGVLKKLTEEYFRNNIRNEDGKILEIKGCKLIVDAEYDEDSFLDTCSAILRITQTANYNYGGVNYSDKKDIHIKCGGNKDMYFNLFSYPEFVELPWNTNKVSEKTYKAFIELMECIMKDINVKSKKDLNGNIGVIELFSYKKLYDEYGDKVSKYNDSLLGEMYDTFGIKPSLDYSFIIDGSKFFLENDITEIRMLIKLPEICEWFKEKKEEIKKIGAEEYFKNIT